MLVNRVELTGNAPTHLRWWTPAMMTASYKLNTRLVPSSKCQVSRPSTQYQVQSAQYQVQSDKYPVQVPSTKCQEPSTIMPIMQTSNRCFQACPDVEGSESLGEYFLLLQILRILTLHRILWWSWHVPWFVSRRQWIKLYQNVLNIMVGLFMFAAYSEENLVNRFYMNLMIFCLQWRGWPAWLSGRRGTSGTSLLW